MFIIEDRGDMIAMTQEERVYEDPDKYRIEDEYKDPNEECECGEPKKVQELFCNNCEKYLQDKLQEHLKTYSRTELEYINEILDGEYIPDYVLGKEE